MHQWSFAINAAGLRNAVIATYQWFITLIPKDYLSSLWYQTSDACYCLNCNESLEFFHTGTEKLEEFLKEYFKNTPVIRVDREALVKSN